MSENLLEIKNLCVEFRTFDGIVKALNGMEFNVPRGKTVGLVGETGAGKTTTALSVMGLIQSPPGVITSGEILFDREDLLKIGQHKLRSYRGEKISMIFQNPMTALNPVYTVGQQIANVIMQHQNISKAEALRRASDMLEVVGIPGERGINYPHEFSGGMKQRVCIAMGLACNPSLLIADEPTTALDVTIQAQILDLMKGLKEKYNTSIIFITHALGVVAEIADYVVVVYAGRVIEKGDIKSIFTDPRHPYTRGLFGCLPDIESEESHRLHIIPGAMPDPMRLPEGCKFCRRCSKAMDICRTVDPKMIHLDREHDVRCHLYTGGNENG